MKERVKKHVDSLFTDVYETRQLRELKEEICSNLLEKINELISMGTDANSAFNQAIEDLGDMGELVDGLKKASDAKLKEDLFKPVPLKKGHIIAYITASVTLLIGLFIGGYMFLQNNPIFTATLYLIPFVLVSMPIFMYFGLTQETMHDYGMNKKRALSYSLASEILLFGLYASGIEYKQGQSLSIIFITLLPFVIIAAIIYIYLGLTEKSRRKMGADWEQEWVNYYSDPQSATMMGLVSGALWIFSIAAFFFIGFSWGWKYSWLVFLIATGCQPLLVAIFFGKKGHGGKLG